MRVRFRPNDVGQHNYTIETGTEGCGDVTCSGIAKIFPRSKRNFEDLYRTSDVSEPLRGLGPPDFVALYQNYPNPFNPVTTIFFALPEDGYVNLSIYDPDGKLVSTLVDGTTGEGIKEVMWDGKDRVGNPVSSGVYFYRLKYGAEVLTKKMVLIR